MTVLETVTVLLVVGPLLVGAVVAGCAVILTAKYPALHSLGIVLMWLVVISAVASAAHYFQMFWSQINTRVQQRTHRPAPLVVKTEEKTEDVLIR